MEKIEVEMLENKTSAKEVNPYKDELDRKYSLGHQPSFGLLEAFRCQENMLRTFEIETIKGLTPAYIMKTVPKLKDGGVGSKHQAEVLLNGKIKIL